MLKQLKRQLTIDSLKALVPCIGIFCFAGCSTHALSEFFREMARTPSPWYDVASWLVEGFSAYVITLLIAQVRIATASIGRHGASKQDQRMARYALVPAYTILASITIAVSMIANTKEFGGNVWLGSLFPSLCVACAIAAGLDDVARAKRKEKESNATETDSKPKPKRKQEFFAECKSCGWFGTNGANQKKDYETARAAQCALNAHKCKRER